MLLPLPLVPTSATLDPAGMSREKFVKIMPSRVGYLGVGSGVSIAGARQQAVGAYVLEVHVLEFDVTVNAVEDCLAVRVAIDDRLLVQRREYVLDSGLCLGGIGSKRVGLAKSHGAGQTITPAVSLMRRRQTPEVRTSS